MTSRRLLSSAGVVGALIAGCGSAGTSTGSFETADGGVDAAPAATISIEAGPPACGDGSCNGTESCQTCTLDCGECPACTLAPSCSDAVGIPASPTPRHDLDQGITEATDPDAGADAGPPSALPGEDGCQDAQLRMRIVSVTANKGGGQIYCLVSASDGVSAEVALTAKTGDLGDGQTSSFDPASAIFWGQGASLHTTTDNLTITYDCFKVVDNSGWASALSALSGAADTAGATVGGPYGWAFGTAAAAAAAAAAAVTATNGDDHLFNAQQTIAKSELLDLTNGRTWAIDESGGSAWTFNAWDWQIAIESWGCAAGSAPPR